MKKLTPVLGLCCLVVGVSCESDDGKRPLGALCGANSQCESGLCGGGLCVDPATWVDPDAADADVTADSAGAADSVSIEDTATDSAPLADSTPVADSGQDADSSFVADTSSVADTTSVVDTTAADTSSIADTTTLADSASVIDSATPAETTATCSGWEDPESTLCWQDPPLDDRVSWNAAIAYCEARGAGWRLPTIDELKSLVRGCSLTACATTDPGCLDEACGAACPSCGAFAGPGPGGCYWDAGLSGACGGNLTWFWSSSDVTDVTILKWNLAFGFAFVGTDSAALVNNVRCVYVP